MKKLPEVDAAKALLTEATAWSVMRWLREKKRVRQTADAANAILDEVGQAVKDGWPESVRAAYETLATPASGSSKAALTHRTSISSPTNGETLSIAKKIKQADDEAYRARMDAEDTFDDAEKKLSTALAREGCRKAIQSWELQEKAIRNAETILPPK